MSTRYVDILAIITLLALFAGASGCNSKEAAAPPLDNAQSDDKPASLKLSPAQMSEMRLTNYKVLLRNLPVELKLPAVVQANPIMTTPVTSLVPGRVEEVRCQPGDKVKKGDLLATIRSDEIGQIESDLLTKIMEMDAELKQVQVKMQLADKIYERKKLLMEEKIAARADLEMAENELEQEKAALRAIKERHDANIETNVQRLKLFGIERKEIDRVLKTREIHHQFEIRAPRSGVITVRDADAGEMIEASKKLFEVADLNHVFFTAQLPEKDIRLVKVGMPVSGIVDSYPDKTFNGKLTFISPQIEAETRSLPVKALFDNESGSLKPEMFGDLTIQTAHVNAMFVPSDCVQQIGESAVVYVKKGQDTYIETRVDTGKRLAEEVEIKAGIKPGDTIAREGSLKLLGMALQRLSK